MKYIFQFFRILCFSFAGEILHFLLPLPIPAGIYGFLLLLLALSLRILPLDAIHQSSSFLLEIMPIFFIPSAVGILNSWESIANIFLPTLFILLGSMILIFFICGRLCQWLLSKKEDK